MSKSMFITIKGTTGTHKSNYADRIIDAARRKGIRAIKSDHELFTRDRGYEERLAKVKENMLKEEAEINIIVINDGEKTLRIEFDSFFMYDWSKIFFPLSHYEHEQEDGSNKISSV
ncbi:MAG: hypothetical protein AAFN77_24255 [Planctomycetota bacterium]